jgi:hypothetical protein
MTLRNQSIKADAASTNNETDQLRTVRCKNQRQYSRTCFYQSTAMKTDIRRAKLANSEKHSLPFKPFGQQSSTQADPHEADGVLGAKSVLHKTVENLGRAGGDQAERADGARRVAASPG